MSGRNYKDYSERVGTYRELSSNNASERRVAEEARKLRIDHAKADINSGRVKAPPPPRETKDLYDPLLARGAITRPAAGVKRVHIVIVDNSGSNRRIAEHLKRSSGYLLATLGMLDHAAQIAFMYVSDHCDGRNLRQDADYVHPTAEGDKILHSSIAQVMPAGGGDAPEAFECALWDACDLDFGDAQDRHLYLVTDVVGHGMGMTADEGCPLGRDWRESLRRVRETYRTFEVIGCGESKRDAQLQRQFLTPERVGYDLLDLTDVPTHEHRCGITGNALLFLIARRRGLQTVEAFLMTLYEKWLTEPIFGANTDLGAREAITRFAKFIEIDDAGRKAMLRKIFGE